MDTNNEKQSVNTTPSTSQAHKGRSPLFLVMGGILIFACGLGIGWYVGSASRTPTIVYENAPEEMTESNISPTASTQEQMYSSDKYGFSFQYPKGFSPNDDIYDLKVITDKTMEQYLEKHTETLDPLGPTTNYFIEDLAKSTLPGKVITKGGVDVSKTIILDANGYLVEFNINMIQFDPDTVDSIVEQVKTIARTVKITQ